MTEPCNHPLTAESTMIVGDIGGTKTNFALLQGDSEPLRLLREASYPTQSASSLEGLIRVFLNHCGIDQPWGICLGFAGTVSGGVVKGVNLPWEIDPQDLRQRLGIHHFYLINDLVAMALSVPSLLPDQTLRLHGPTKSGTGTIGILAAGTGLGQAILAWDGKRYVPVATEGGHKDFAARTPLEFRLCQHLMEKYGHASVERVLSGNGIIDCYAFLLAEQGRNMSMAMKSAAVHGDASLITAAALSATDSEAVAALDLFVSLLAAEAGNLALQSLATGGIYIGGGIAPRILPLLQGKSFSTSFRAKGRMAGFLEQIAVHVILDGKAPLQGAAAYLLAKT